MYYANYHTHTPRCRHAIGTVKEMAQAAYNSGIRILGISDHSPQAFEHGFISGMRMTPEAVPEYVAEINEAKKEFEGRVEIKIGFEAEYFPRIFHGLYDVCKKNDIDYMILGQHFLPFPDGYTYEYIGNGFPVHTLKSYVDACIEGLETGCFSYIAHPDVYSSDGVTDETYYKEFGRLLGAAADLNIPLEVNKLGFNDGRWYPSSRFFNLAKKYKSTVIMGVDAHTPDHFNRAELDRCYQFMAGFGLKIIDEPELLHPWKD